MEEREFWAMQAEVNYQTSLVKDSQVKFVLRVYRWANLPGPLLCLCLSSTCIHVRIAIESVILTERWPLSLRRNRKNIMTLYRYALFLEEHAKDLNQAIELYRCNRYPRFILPVF